jgi:hypothetical protein
MGSLLLEATGILDYARFEIAVFVILNPSKDSRTGLVTHELMNRMRR